MSPGETSRYWLKVQAENQVSGYLSPTINLAGYGNYSDVGFNLAASGTHAILAQWRIEPGLVQLNGASVTDAYTLLVGGVPTWGANNYAMRILSGLSRLDGNLAIGGNAARATTAGTNRLDIFDGTAPVGTLAAGISLYSTAGELRAMDSAGNATLLSPHDAEGRWIYLSRNGRTGRVLRVDMERLVKALNELHGWDFVREWAEAA